MMAEVSLTINERSYRVACDDGQEEHLKELGAFIDTRVAELVESLGQVGEQRLLVMASLLIANDLYEALQAIEDQKRGEANGKGGDPTAEERFAEALDSCAKRIEGIALSLEGA